MANRRRLRQKGFTLAIALGLGWALIALLGFPPIGQAAEFWSHGLATARSGVAMVICLVWITVALALVYATFSTIVAVGDHIDMVRLERRRKLLLGASGFVIGLLALLMSHAETVHPGSISEVLALVRRH
jgi:hypothetical protein